MTKNGPKRLQMFGHKRLVALVPFVIPSARIVLTALIAFSLFGCGGGNAPPQISQPEPYTYSVPESDDDWATAHLSDVGLEKNAFESMLNLRDMEALNVHSILVVKDGALVFEEYFTGEDSQGNTIAFDKDTPHEMFSVTKSIASLLTGIAIDRNAISSVDDRVIDYLPNHASLLNVDEKADITLYDSLTMQAGIEWFELSPLNSDSPSYRFKLAADPLTYLFSLPQASAPGTSFAYNTGVASTMGEIIFTATGQRVDRFAEDNLFGPLNITDVSWQRHASGHIYTGSGLQMLPRDMAKIGQLLLNDGVWEGNEIISADWLSESTFAHVEFGGAFNYGYYWWLWDMPVDENTTTRVVYAAGFGGQMIFIMPEFSMTVVFTSGNFGGGNREMPNTILEEDILPGLIR